jgi:hypothetical protein
MGGGLHPKVLEKGMEKWNNLDPKVDLRCRLYETLSSIYQAGAEKERLKGASIAVDGEK